MPRWLGLSEAVRTGGPTVAVNQEENGGEFFRDFVMALFPLNYTQAQAVAEILKVDQALTPVRVLDLAAGSGVWGIAVAQASPQVQVTAVDWPAVIDATRETAERFGLADRVHCVGGDLLEVDFGKEHTVAILGHILHSEGERRSRVLLKKTFDALASGGTIVIADWLVDPDRRGPAHALIFAVNMLISTEEGDTFSFEEISSWLREAGFTDTRAVDVSGHSPLILAAKP